MDQNPYSPPKLVEVAPAEPLADRRPSLLTWGITLLRTMIYGGIVAYVSTFLWGMPAGLIALIIISPSLIVLSIAFGIRYSLRGVGRLMLLVSLLVWIAVMAIYGILDMAGVAVAKMRVTQVGAMLCFALISAVVCNLIIFLINWISGRRSPSYDRRP